jgi:hypothetical protein
MIQNYPRIYEEIIQILRKESKPLRIDRIRIADCLFLKASITQEKTVNSHIERMVRLGYLFKNNDRTYRIAIEEERNEEPTYSEKPKSELSKELERIRNKVNIKRS